MDGWIDRFQENPRAEPRRAESRREECEMARVYIHTHIYPYSNSHPKGKDETGRDKKTSGISAHEDAEQETRNAGFC